MKRLDQLDSMDLMEFHSEMMGEDPVDTLSLFQVDTLNAEEELLEKERYEQRNRHSDKKAAPKKRHA